MIRRPPRSTLDRSSAASDVYKRQVHARMARPGEKLLLLNEQTVNIDSDILVIADDVKALAMAGVMGGEDSLSLIHISEPTRPY